MLMNIEWFNNNTHRYNTVNNTQYVYSIICEDRIMTRVTTRLPLYYVTLQLCGFLVVIYLLY